MFQWSLRSYPPGVTASNSIATPRARPSAATISGRSFQEVRLLPRKSTRNGGRALGLAEAHEERRGEERRADG